MTLTRLQACLAAILLWLPVSTVAQDRLVDQNCQELPNVCPLPLDCYQSSSSVDNESCFRCIVPNPIGQGCSISGVDPHCEAQKAAKRASAEIDRAAKKAACETQNAINLQLCRKRIDTAIADCRVARSAATGQETDPYTTLLVTGGQGEAKKIPAAARNRLVGSGLYDAHLVDGLQVVQLSPNARVPPALNGLPTGFSVGDRVFLKNIKDADAAPLEFWVRQLEMSRLYSDYGIKELGVALTSTPSTILDLVETKVRKRCAILECGPP